jgi:hypothetical protein
VVGLILECLQEALTSGSVRGTELGPITMPVALGHPPCRLSFYFLLPLEMDVIYIYKDDGKLVPLHPLAPVSPTAMSRGPGAQVRHTAPSQWGASSVDRKDGGFPRERCRIASAPKVRDAEVLIKP